MGKNNGGSAFPVANLRDPNQSDGMSLRDWFASNALSALITKSSPTKQDGYDELVKCIVNQAYNIADAMLAEWDK